MDDPLSLIVWAVFFYSASMMPLGLMLGSACCGCNGDKVKCFSPTHRCFRRLLTYPDGRKTAYSNTEYVHFGHSYLSSKAYSSYFEGYTQYGYSSSPSSLSSAGVFVSHANFELDTTVRVIQSHELSYGETAIAVATATAQGVAYPEGDACQPATLPSEIPVTLEGGFQVAIHGWDFPIHTSTQLHSLNSSTLQSSVINGKKGIYWSKNATLSHSVVGLQTVGTLITATPEQIAAALSVQVNADGSYIYTASLPAAALAYADQAGTIRWTVRVFHGQAFHDDIVSVNTPSATTPIPEEHPAVLTAPGIHIPPPLAVNAPPPQEFYDSASNTLNVWPRSRFTGGQNYGPVTLKASQEYLIRIVYVTFSYNLTQNPLGWNDATAVQEPVFGLNSLRFPEAAYFHRPPGILYSSSFPSPCYTSDSDAVLAYMAGEAGLVYEYQRYGYSDLTGEFRLESDNPLCELDVTHLPASLLPDSVSVSHPDGEPLYRSGCEDCPSTVSMKRTSNTVYFSPAADIQNTSFENNYGYNYNYYRSYSGGYGNYGYYYYGNAQMTPFAVTLVEAIGHSDAIAYLEGFYADSTKISWRDSTYYQPTGFEAVCTIGGEDFPENFDTPLVKHVTSHATTPLTIGVHGYRGVYPHSSYKVEVAISDVSVVTQWEQTVYTQDYRVARAWLVGGSPVYEEPEEGTWRPFYDEIQYIPDSYPHQPQFDLPNTKKDKILEDIAAIDPTVDEVFLNSSGLGYHQNQYSYSWDYTRDHSVINGSQIALRRLLKCDGTFDTSALIGRTPSYLYSEQPLVDSDGNLNYFYSGYGNFYDSQIYLADELPPPPEEVPSGARVFDPSFYNSWWQSSFSLPARTVPLPPNDEDSYEVAFYISLHTQSRKATIPTEQVQLNYGNWSPPRTTETVDVNTPGVPYDSTGIYLLKVTCSVTVTKGDPPSDSCNISVDVGNPDTPAEPISKEDITFTFNTECSLPSSFRGHIWPHAGLPTHDGYYGYYGYGTSLSGKGDGHVFHLIGNDPDGSVDTYQDQARTPYNAHPFSPINVGETLYPHPQTTSFRPGSREGVWQGHIYVQGEQYDDLTYTYQHTSAVLVDSCETNKANWRLLVNRDLTYYYINYGYGDETNTQVGNAMSREAKYAVIGWHVPDETVRVGYISHKQYGRIPVDYDPSGREETFPGSGWRAVSRYFHSFAAGLSALPSGMVATSSEATCDSSGRFSVDLNESDLDGDISIYVQPVNPKTSRGLIEYVRATPTLEECRDYWTFVTAIFVTKSLASPAAVVPSARTYYYQEETLADYAVTGGHVVGHYTSVRLVVEGMVNESSVATRVRLYDALSGKAISQATVGGGDFENGLVTISGGSDYSPGSYNSDSSYTTGSSESALWFTPHLLFADGQVIQVAAVMEDDLGNESPPTLMSGLIRMDYTSPTLDTVYVNGIEHTSGRLVLNDISKQTPVVISGITEPGCKVKIGDDETVSAGVVTALAATGTGEYSLPTTFFDSPIGTFRSGTLTSTDVAKNSLSRSVAVNNRLPEVVYARISGGLMVCRLNYVQKNATVSIMFLRSDGESSPVLTPDATGGTAEATFTDAGFSVDFLYAVQIEVTIPNGATVFQEQRDVVQV
jgi:hypothetical protein